MIHSLTGAAGAGGGIRTHTPCKAQVPKTCASTIPPLRLVPLYSLALPFVPLYRGHVARYGAGPVLLMVSMLLFLVPASAQQEPARWQLGLESPVRLDSIWVEHLQQGAVRLGGCTATFVSSTGLLVTSYACARRNVRSAWRVEHVPMEAGFYAPDLMDERRVPLLVADRLLQVRRANGSMPADSVWRSNDGLMVTEVRLAADSTTYLTYTFRRYEDVRVVMLPERSVAWLGGESDKGTYPRFSLGVGFLRVYDYDGHPVLTESYLPLSGAGVLPGEALYSISLDRPGPHIGFGHARGMPYNGTWAPPYTTLFGLFDLHYAHGSGTAWEVPASWHAQVAVMDLSAQLNVASTTPCVADGAPLVNTDLEVLAVSFDVTSVKSDTRCIGVVGPGIFEVLRSVYQAAALVAELDLEGLDDYVE